MLRLWAFWKGRGRRARSAQAAAVLAGLVAALAFAWVVGYLYACQSTSC